MSICTLAFPGVFDLSNFVFMGPNNSLISKNPVKAEHATLEIKKRLHRYNGIRLQGIVPSFICVQVQFAIDVTRRWLACLLTGCCFFRAMGLLSKQVGHCHQTLKKESQQVPSDFPYNSVQRL